MDIEKIYSLYVHDIYRYLYSLCRNESIAEDLMQDTFYKAHVTLLTEAIFEIKPWLFKVAYYTYIDFRRKEQRLVISESIEQKDDATPDAIALTKDGFQTAILDLKINTLKSHLSRGRKKMRKLIKKEDVDNG